MADAEFDPWSGVPMYRQIKDILRSEIIAGTADPAFPMTEVQLLERFKVSRAPIRQALKELAHEGYVYRKQGRGTFPVTGSRVRRPADVKPGALYRYLRESGLQPKSTVADVGRVVPPAHIGEALQIQTAEKLLHFSRVISLEGSPLVQADVYIRAPQDFVPTAAELEEQESAFELLARNFSVVLERAEHEAWATEATPQLAKALGVPEGNPLLIIETVFFSVGGVPVGWRHAVHLAEDFKYRFVTDS